MLHQQSQIHKRNRRGACALLDVARKACARTQVSSGEKREAAIVLVAAVLLTAAHYHGSPPWLGPRTEIFGFFALSFGLFFLAPALLILLGFREPLSAYGLRLGKRRVLLRDTAVVAAIIIPVMAVASRFPALHEGVPRYRAALDEPWLLLPLILGWGAYFFAWEFFFRGFLLFGLGRRLGPLAIFLQLVPFVMAHYPKSEVEAIGSMALGLLLGGLAWRAESFLGAWLIHWLLAAAINVFVVLWKQR